MSLRTKLALYANFLVNFKTLNLQKKVNMGIIMSDLESKKTEFHRYVRALQDEITMALFDADPKLNLEEDLWERRDHLGNPGGGGITRAFSGDIIENAGVNTSMVFGAIDPLFAGKLGGTGDQMWAAGISLIIHPKIHLKKQMPF